jgi:DNA primase catalytic subunit
MLNGESYKIVYLNTEEKKQIQELIKKLASEERIGIDEHIYKDNRAYDRWGINPFQLFEFIKQILINPEIKRKELHDTEYFPTRYLCESEFNEHIYPCIIGIEKSNHGLIIVITLLSQKKKRSLRK